MHTPPTRLAALLATLACALALAQETSPPPAAGPVVVFVCEHGSVKSLIGASLFEQRARALGLQFRAISRGLSPDANVPPKIAEALQSDGVDVSGYVPQALGADEVASAERVIAIGVDLAPFAAGARQPIEQWSDVPPASVDYAAARAALLRHVDALLAELKAGR